MNQPRNLKGQFAKEEPYSRIASLCGFIVIIASVGLIGLNIYRQNKKVDKIITLDQEMIEYTRQIVVAQKQQEEADKALAEQVEEVKQEVKEVKATIGETDNQRKVEIEIRKIAQEKNFKWPDYLVRLAFCESRLNPSSINTKGNYPATSKDRGLFQYNSHWQKQVSDECAFDLRCSTEKTIEKINAGGQGIWVCNDIVLGKK